jgi:PAS domain S-box-containing protein
VALGRPAALARATTLSLLMSRGAGPPEERDQFQLLVESVVDYAIFMLDPHGVIRTWNAGAERIKGYKASEIVGKHFSIFYPGADARRGKPDYELRIAADEGRYEEEGWRVRKDGSTFWASVVITALRNTRRELVGFAKVTRDLTERRKYEDQRGMLFDRERTAREEAETSLKQLRVIQRVTDTALAHLALDDLLNALLDRVVELLVVDTAAILLVSEDETSLVARASHGIEEEVQGGVRIPLGQGFAGRVAKDRRPVILEDIRHSNVLNPMLREKGIRSLLGVPLVAHGKLLGVLHVGALLPGRFQPRDAEILEVVADRIAIGIENANLFAEARAAKTEAAEMEAAVKLRDEFLSVAAHELKTPLTAAKSATQLLARTFKDTKLTNTQERALNTVDKQIAKLARLASQLLDTVRLESGRLSIEMDDADLVEVVRSAIQQIEVVTDRHTFTLDAPSGLRMRVDALRLEQVLTNLLDNAVKFSPAGGTVEVTIKKEIATAVLTVRDHGIGVAREHRAKLFEQFYQAHPNRSGLGLGLYISRHIVERHGGTMYAEEPSGAGTRFVISLPTPGAVPVVEPAPQEQERPALQEQAHPA